MGQLLYKHFKNKAQELIYKDFDPESKVKVTTYGMNGVSFTSSAAKYCELYVARMNTKVNWKTLTFGIKVDSHSDVTMSTVIDEIAPGLKAVLTLKSHANPGKVEVEYVNQNVGLCASFGLNKKPILNFSAVMGNKNLCVGADVSFNTKYRDFLGYGAGVRYSKKDFITTIALTDKCEIVNATYYHKPYPFTNTAVGTEFSYSFSPDVSLLTFAIQHEWDKRTNIKARADSIGMLSGLVQHRYGSHAVVTVSCEVDYMDIEKRFRFGLSLALSLSSNPYMDFFN